MRMGVGVVGLLVLLWQAFALHGAGVPPAWRLSLALPAFVAALGFLQAKQNT